MEALHTVYPDLQRQFRIFLTPGPCDQVLQLRNKPDDILHRLDSWSFVGLNN